jgi:hypothetical protein
LDSEYKTVLNKKSLFKLNYQKTLGITTAVAIAALLSFSAVSRAFADTIVDTIVDSNGRGDLPVPAGGTGSNSYAVQVLDPNDPVNGCDATGSTPTTVLIHPLGPGITVRLSTQQAGTGGPAIPLTFTGCGTFQGVNFDVSTTTPAGTYPVSVSASGGKSGSTYDLSQAQLTITVTASNHPPTVSLSPPSGVDLTDVQAQSSAGTPLTFSVSASDLDTGDTTTTTCTGAAAAPPGPFAGPGSTQVTFTFPYNGGSPTTTTVTCRATDNHGLQSSPVTASVTVADTTKPIFSAVSDITAEATSSSGASVTFTNPTATDSVSGPINNVGCSPASGSLFQLGTTIVTCSATDGSGNTGTTSFAVLVKDTTAPALPALSDLTAEATSASGAVVSYATPIATDSVDPNPSVTCAPASGSTFALGSTSVTCTATDATGNHATGTFAVLVKDTTAPTLTTPGDRSAVATTSAGVGAGIITYAATATDSVDPNPSVTCAPASGSPFPLGSTSVTCTATDATGNHATGTFAVKIGLPTWSGILQPINTDGSSIFKAGSTVPIKFQLVIPASLGGGYVSDAVAKLTYGKIANTVEGNTMEAISTASSTSGNLFRYDSTANQYVFNLATKGLTTGTYVLHIDIGDLSSNTATISLK